LLAGSIAKSVRTVNGGTVYAPPLIVLPAFADRQSKGCREALPYHPGIAADKPEFEFLQIMTF
jgi:hypothetical protein